MIRRQFLHVAAAAGCSGLAANLLGSTEAAGADDPPSIRETVRGDMRYRPLGRTGVEVSAIGLGGYHIGVPADENEGIKIIRTAIDAGITFLDNSWDYHGGGSEIRMGKALGGGYRDKVFLMTRSTNVCSACRPTVST
jgi:hypothetical protein